VLPNDGVPDVPRAEALTGLVERVTYHNEENGFCVLRIKVRGRKELETLIGHAPRSPLANSSPPSGSGA